MLHRSFYSDPKYHELKSVGIGFTEYFIDRDADRREELNRKLEQSGLPPQRYGTPIMDVHGTMLPNNPSLETIRRYMGET